MYRHTVRKPYAFILVPARHIFVSCERLGMLQIGFGSGIGSTEPRDTPP
jgi:hypothetical protein